MIKLRWVAASTCILALGCTPLGCTPLGCTPLAPPTAPKPPPTQDDEAPGAKIETPPADDGAAAAGSSAPQPAPAPGEIVLHARWQNANDTIDGLMANAKIPSRAVDALKLELAQGLIHELARSRVRSHDLAKFVDLTAPIDVVVAADMAGRALPTPYIGVSVGVSSVAEALKTSTGKPSQIADGVWELGDEQSWGAPCAIVTASGKTPARLVCGDRKRDLEKLGPYLARTLATQTGSGGDIHAELKLRPLFDKYGRKWALTARGLPALVEDKKIGIPIFDDALMDAAGVLGSEAGLLIGDLDGVTADVDLDKTKGVTASLELKWVNSQSWLVQTTKQASQLMGPAPALFWRLPKQAIGGGFGYSGDKSRFAGIVGAAQKLLEGAMDKEHVGTQADRKAIVKLLDMPLQKNAAMAYASGAFTSGKKAKSPIVDAVSTAVGWHVMGVEQGSADIKKYLQDAVKAYNRSTLQQYMKKEAGSDAKYLPTIKTSTGPAALGAGSLAVEVKVANIEDPMSRATGKPDKLAFTAHILVMADGKRTWIGLAADRDKLAKVMAGLKGSGGDTIDSIAKLSPFKSGRFVSGSYTSLSSMVGAADSIANSLMDVMPGEIKVPMTIMQKMFAQLPNKGADPLTMTSTVGSTSATTSLNVPAGALADLGFIGGKLFQMFVTKGQP